jgi:N-acetylmuramic acid 6-phosphate (MurNAc-6-P) etherase
VKPAVLLCAGAKDIAAAQRLLAAANGNLRLAMSRLADT